MDPAQVTVFFVLALTMLCFVKEWMPVEITALAAAGCLMVVEVLTGWRLLSPAGFLRGFSNPAPVTIGCMFVLSAALERTGVIDKLARWLIAKSGGSMYRALLLLLAVPLPLSAFVNNTPIVVILMPAVLAMSRVGGVAPSKLLIPLSYATILGGTCSMIGTSTNLIVDGMARDAGLPPMGLFAITPLGLVYALIGAVYLLVLAPRILPTRETVSSLLPPEARREFLVQAAVPDASPLLGQRLGDLLANAWRGQRILEVRRRGINRQEALTDVVLEAGDRILIRTGTRGVQELKATDGVAVGFHGIDGLQAMEERDAVIMEGIIGPSSPWVGRSLRSLQFRQRYGVLILAIHREGKNVTAQMENLAIEFGDTLLVEGPPDAIQRLMAERGFVNLSEVTTKPVRRGKALFALGAMAVFMLGGLFSVIETSVLAFLCALAVVLCGCLKPREAYDAVDWRILLMIIGMLGVGRAMENSGTAASIAGQMTSWFAPFGPLVLLSALYLLASILTEMISNNAVAALLTPIALKMADNMDVNPLPFVIALMFGASASFATPIGYQTNTYVYGAGGYRFSDFLKVGVPLNLLLWGAATFLIPWFWPL